MRTRLWAAAAVAATGALAADSPQIAFTRLLPSLIQQRLEQAPRRLADRKATLEALFQEAGCKDDRFTEQPVPGSKAPNLICALPGETDSEIVVGGHLDSIESGMGAVDDWSGSVLLPSLYQSLKDSARRHRFVFIGFAAEESGLVGSEQFVKKLARDERPRIHAMINLECLGLGPPVVWTHRANPHLLQIYSQVANALHFDLLGVNVENVGDDDSHPFVNAKIPVLTIHSITSQTIGILHSPRDQVSAIHSDDYYNSYRLIASYLAYLDAHLD